MRKEVSLTAHPEYCRTPQCSGEALRALILIIFTQVFLVSPLPENKDPHDLSLWDSQ